MPCRDLHPRRTPPVAPSIRPHVPTGTGALPLLPPGRRSVGLGARRVIMARHAALPPTLAPRLVSREAAAAYFGISATMFDKLVISGTAPQPKRIGTRKLWDVRALDAAVDNLPDDGLPVADDSWADVDAA
jgi:predicted DNA-binding transcriptional regulator AlpA